MAMERLLVPVLSILSRIDNFFAAAGKLCRMTKAVLIASTMIPAALPKSRPRRVGTSSRVRHQQRIIMGIRINVLSVASLKVGALTRLNQTVGIIIL